MHCIVVLRLNCPLNFQLARWDAEVYTGPLSDPRADLEELDRVVLQLEQWTREGVAIKS